MKSKKFIFVFILIILFILCGEIAKADDNFNPNYIISDVEILDYNSMNFEAIKEFLNNKQGYIANGAFEDSGGKKMSAAEIIYDRTVTNQVNPKFIIVLLQKEQSLIEDKNPSQTQLDWAAGYGCPDNAGCNPRWQGFWKQINSASLQFRDYMDNPQLYTYKAGYTYTFTNPYSDEKNTLVTPANRATAALYNYTPHVYNGNYNFYKIWQRYFSRDYIDGSLLQAEGEVGVWLLQNGKKRPFLTKGALTSRFDINKIIIVNKSDLDKYEKGASIKFPQYSLVQSPNGSIYLLVDNKRRVFSDNEAFRRIGFNPNEVISASWEDINSYQEGLPINASSTYPTGALLQDKTTGGVYWVFEGKKAPLWDPIFLKTKFKNKKIIPATQEELLDYNTADPVVFDDGELLKSSTSPAVFIIANSTKRPITSGKLFEELGYQWQNIITVSPKILNIYDNEEPISEISK